MNPAKLYIVYKRTSPAGLCYIGYTSCGLMKRWRVCVEELLRKDRKSPLAQAIKVHGHDNWVHEVLYETDCKELALDAEIVYISLLGQYNISNLPINNRYKYRN